MNERPNLAFSMSVTAQAVPRMLDQYAKAMAASRNSGLDMVIARDIKRESKMAEIQIQTKHEIARAEKIRNLKSITINSINFMLPSYKIMELTDIVIQDWIQSSEVTCKIDVINGNDVGSKIPYIKWPERRTLRVPLVHYFLHLFSDDDEDSLVMIECMRVLNLILGDLHIVILNDSELIRCWVYDIFNAIQQGLKEVIK